MGLESGTKSDRIKLDMRKFLIIDDHALMRRGLKQLLADEFPNAILGEARDGAEALQLIQQQKWDVVILDIFLPGRSGLDVLNDIKHVEPELPVLIHSMHPEDQFAVRAFKGGASGYICKTDLPEELLKAMQKILAGGRYVSPALAEKLAFSLADKVVQAPHEKLSDREFQVLRMIAAGKATSEIAKELSLSAKTISTYRARILDKMKMKTNAELIYYMIEHRLNDP